jgi:MFS family permease
LAGPADPDFRRCQPRRTVLATLCFTEAISWGCLVYAFPVLIGPMERELGASRPDLGAAFSLALLVSALAAVPVGRWLDRAGGRLPMTVGSGLAAVGLLAWSRVETTWQLYPTFAVLGLAMSLVLYEAAFALLARSFAPSPLRAMALLTMLAALGGIAFPPLTNGLVEAVGWRGCLTILAAGLFVLTALPHATLLRAIGPARASNPRATAAESSVAQAIGTSGFWALTAAFVLGSFTWMALVVHFVPYLIETGHSATFAAAALGLLAGMQIPGRALLALERRGRSAMRRAMLTFVLQTLGLLALLGAAEVALVIAFIVVFGAAKGAATILRPAALAERYGVSNYATITGATALFVIGTQALAPFGAALLHEAFGSYRPMIWALAGASLLAAACAAIADRTPGAPKTPTLPRSQVAPVMEWLY